MYTDTPAPAPPRPKARSECCTDAKCDSSVRNNYFDGKRLTTESFRVEQEYLLERRRLLNRAIHGWGVVYGYAVAHADNQARREPKLLHVGAGLALDACGRELIQTRERALGFDDLIWLDANKKPVTREEALGAAAKTPVDHRRKGQCWLLSVHYAEQHVDPIDVDGSCRCRHREWDRTCETVRYSLRNVPCDECCADFECEIACDCSRGPCCDPAVERERTPGKDTPLKRGGCGCLCEHLTGLEPGAGCGPLCEIEEPCAQVQVDVDHGVPLACLVRDYDEKDDEKDTSGLDFELEACGPRRLVKRNDLLFDLIRGCDLTRIVDFGWKQWHRDEEPPVPFERFAEALGADAPRGEKEYLTKAFWVKFSRPVRKDTLRPDVFAMTVLSPERGEGWWETLRVPIVRIDTTLTPPEPGDPADHVRSARIVVGGRWFDDAIRGSETRFERYESRVEIEVRGDFILDCNGQTVDSNARGLSPLPTGNGAPGDSFSSGFRVARKTEPPVRDYPSDTVDRPKGASS